MVDMDIFSLAPTIRNQVYAPGMGQKGSSQNRWMSSQFLSCCYEREFIGFRVPYKSFLD
jgi:hypothetical protein